jgi:hypothetical protein
VDAFVLVVDEEVVETVVEVVEEEELRNASRKEREVGRTCRCILHIMTLLSSMLNNSFKTKKRSLKCCRCEKQLNKSAQRKKEN